MEAHEIKALMAQPTMSRRAFFGLTAVVGALHFMGSTCVGNSVVAAYADDNGNTYFVVVVVGREEFTAFVVDSANGNKAIAGANVTVTSLYNDQSVTGTTSDKGIFIANVRKLAVNQDDDFAERFWFFAKAEVVPKGYREFAFLRQHIYSGPQPNQQAHILLPTQPYTEGSGPYLRAACFDGSDMLYRACDMPKYAKNDATHTATFQVVCAKGTEATLSFCADGSSLGSGKATATDAGYATIELSGKWVQDLKWGTAFTAEFSAGGSKTLVCDLKLGIREKRFDYVDEPTINENWAISIGYGAGERKADGTYDGGVPQATSNAGSAYKPKKYEIEKMPWGTGMVIEETIPWMPITKGMLPDGGLGFEYSSDRLTLFSNDKATDNPAKAFKESWKRTPEGAEKQWRDNYNAAAKNGVDRFREAQQMRSPKLGLGAKGYFDLDISYHYTFGAGAYIKSLISDLARKAREELLAKGQGSSLGPLNYEWDAVAYASFALVIAGELGAQCAAGPVPVLVNLDFHLSACPAIEAGVTFKMFFSSPKWFAVSQGSSGKGGFTIDLHGEAGLSVGVGVRGFISVSVRGYVCFPVRWAFIKSIDEKTQKELPFPHTTVSGRAGVELVFQVLFLKFRVPFFKPKTFMTYDNWNTNGELSAANDDTDFYHDPALGLPMGEYGDEEATYTADSQLIGTAELNAELNDQGVFCNYDLSDLVLPDASKMAEQAGFYDPFSTEDGAGYDPRKGLKPKLQEPFTSSLTDAFSDPRTKIIQAGETLYICRIATVSVQTTANNNNISCVKLPLSECTEGTESSVTFEEGSEDYFFLPKTTETLPHLTYMPGNSTGDGTLCISENYIDVSMYKGGAAGAVPVADVDLPVCSLLGDTDGVTYFAAGTGADDLELYAIALAIETGQNYANEDSFDSTVVQNAIDAKKSYEKLNGLESYSNSISRTRIVITPFNLKTRAFGKSDVIDFALPSSSAGSTRANMNDVDFSVKADGDTLLFGIVSMTKPLRSRRTLEGLKRLLFTSVLRYVPASSGDEHGTVKNVNCNMFEQTDQDRYEWKAEPFTMMRKGASDSEKKRYIGLVTTGPAGTRGGAPERAIAMHFYPEDGKKASSVANASVNTAIYYPPYATHALNDDGVLQAFVQSRGADKSDALVFTWQYAERYANDQEARPAQVDKERAALWSFDTDGKCALLHANPYDFKGAENFTVCGADKGIVWMERNAANTEVVLKNVKIDSTTALPLETVDLGNLDTNGFITSGNSDFLYGVRVKEGSMKMPTDEEVATTREMLADGGVIYSNDSGFASEGIDLESLCRENASAEVKDYQLVACRWDPKYKKYREFFPFAQLESAPDDFTACPIPDLGGYGATSIVYSTITNLRSQKGKLTYTEVQPAKALKFLTVECFDNFIKAGGNVTVHPMVRVCNVGNLPITAFTVNFMDKQSGGTVLGTCHVTQLEKRVTNPLRPIRERDKKKMAEDAGLNYADIENDAAALAFLASESSASAMLSEENGDSYSAEDEAILWPGSTRNYRTEFLVPKDWTSGEHSVYVQLSDIEVPSFKANNADDDDECLLFENEGNCFAFVDPAIRPFTIADDESQEITADFSPVDYREKGADSNAVPSAKTGDSGSALACVLAAAALAAGAASAVSAKLGRDGLVDAKEAPGSEE